MIRLDGVWHRTGSVREWGLRDVSLELGAGEIGAVLGPNGAGKSLLLRVAATLEAPSRGSVTLLGVDAVSHPEQMRHRIGYLGPSLPPATGTVRDRLDAHAFAHRVPSAVVADVLELTELEPLAGVPLADLSDGERRRAELARVLLHDPAVLLLDDPDRGLTADARSELAGFLAEMAALGRTVLLATHDLALARAAGALCWTLSAGAVTDAPERPAGPVAASAAEGASP